ncbi:MAG: DUF721 domain-containing protein [bacterium]
MSTLSSFKSFADVFSHEREFEKMRHAIEEYDVVEKFKEIFPDLKSVAKPVKAEKATLFLRVENSVWRSELNIRRSLMIEKINKFFSKKIITAIKFTA